MNQPAQPEVITLDEWEGPRLLPGYHLADHDRALVETLSTVDRRLVIEEVGDGLRVTATSWIGVVRLTSLELRVVPKYAGGDLGVLRMLDYASSFNALARYDALRSLKTEGRSLVDLLGWLLADRCDAIVKAGVLAEYVHRDEELRVLRGRLRVLDQVRRHYGGIDRLECAFDEHETDVLENRILAAAVGVARRVCSDPTVVARLSRLTAVFEGACDPSDLDPTSARETLEYNRRNEHYRVAHGYAWLFLYRRGVDDVFASGGTRSFAFLLDMNQLFEDFVTRLLRDSIESAGVRVLAQRRDRSIIENEATRRPYAAIIPDVLLDWHAPRGRTRMPIDAKYKLYDARRIEPSDMYQAFFYAYAYHRPAVDPDGVPVALIMYPSSSGGLKAALQVRGADGRSVARIRAVGVDIPTVLGAIERREIWSLAEVLEVRRQIGPVVILQHARSALSAVS